jgi:hypothetical protein
LKFKTKCFSRTRQNLQEVSEIQKVASGRSELNDDSVIVTQISNLGIIKNDPENLLLPAIYELKRNYVNSV